MSSILPLAEPIVQNLPALRADLVAEFQRTLREGMFANRSEVRPSMLARMGAAEADAVLHFCQQPDLAFAAQRGADLCEGGLSDDSVFRLGQAARSVFAAHLKDSALMAMLGLHAAYQGASVQGFMQSREKIILSEQERIRSALQRTLNRYSFQMELAAGVAAATTSVLDPDDLFAMAVDLIRERFDLYYAGIFLLDDQGLWAVLRAGSGEAGQTMLRHAYRLEVTGDSLIARCLTQGEAQISLGIAKDDARVEDPYLPETLSEIAIPLTSRTKVIGAMSVHSQRVAAFTDQDVTVLRILANQLANAIENARLFAELRQSEEKYRTILENIEEGYYETDLYGCFTFVNDSASAILGYPRQRIQGQPYWSFSAPEQAPLVAATFHAVHQTGQPTNGIEFQILRMDDTNAFVETSVAIMRDSAGEPIGFRGVIRDTTRRKLAEQLLIERKALERSNRELERFAYVASHDLQEPLRKIQTFGDRLKTRHGTLLNDEGRDFLERMLNASSRMQSLIDDLLTLSRVATTAQPFVSVDLARVASEVIFDLETSIEQSGGRVEIGELATLDADPLQMRQLLQNLIGNALKFHQPEVPPVIKVHGRMVRPPRAGRALGPEGLYQLMVEDNGIGIDEKYIGRIFQPFQRLHGRNAYAGTGIGLSICQRIVERHGGRITVQSIPGQGATFSVTLPMAHAKEVVGA